jgi:hypothetical protein
LFASILFRGEITILVKDILDVQIPVITADAILPVPINPSFIIFTIY